VICKLYAPVTFSMWINSCFLHTGGLLGLRARLVELIVIINKICYCWIWLVVYIIVSTIQGHTNIKLYIKSKKKICGYSLIFHGCNGKVTLWYFKTCGKYLFLHSIVHIIEKTLITKAHLLLLTFHCAYNWENIDY